MIGGVKTATTAYGNMNVVAPSGGADYAGTINSFATTATEIANTIAQYKASAQAAKAAEQAAALEKQQMEAAAQNAKDTLTYNMYMAQIQAANERQKLAQQQAHEYELALLELEALEKQMQNDGGKSKTGLYVGIGLAAAALIGVVAYVALKK